MNTRLRELLTAHFNPLLFSSKLVIHYVKSPCSSVLVFDFILNVRPVMLTVYIDTLAHTDNFLSFKRSYKKPPIFEIFFG